MDLLTEIRAVAERHIKVESYVRADAKADSEAVVAQKKRSNNTYLPDYTRKFLKAIQYPLPKGGRVIFLNVPIFANPGDGKTFTAITVIMHLMKFYGSDNVAVSMSDHIPSLVDAMRSNRKPVQILIIDDALKNYSSRGGGNNELLEAIELFTTLRHEFESAQNTLDGIVFTMFTSQMYKGLDKVFREGFPIFKSALVSDKEEIMSATQMGSTAWDYLLEILRDVKVNHQEDRMSDSVVILPGLPAGKITLPPLVGDQVVDEVLFDLAENGNLQAEEFLGDKKVSIALKYKCIERAWTIQRTRLTSEEELARLSRVMDSYATRFATSNEEDPGTNEGKAAIRSWLERRVYDLNMAVEERIPSDDYLKIRVPGTFKVFCEKVATARSRMARARVISEGFSVSGETLGDNEIMDYCAKYILEKFNFDPENPEHWKVFLSLLYKVPPDVRQDAIRLKTPIKDRIRDMWRGAHPVPNSGRAAPMPMGPVKPEAPAVPRVTDISGDYFMLDRAKELDGLIQAAALKQSTDLTFRHLMVYKACEFGLKWGEKTLDNPTDIATLAEGQKWQEETFGEVVSRVPLEKSKHAGKKIFKNHVGGLYESFCFEKLKAGYTVPGVFDRLIADVEHGGGNGHTPDITITYNDGSKDYVSLKCYENAETFSITAKVSGDDEINPERTALAKDEANGIKGNRVVLLVRNLAYDGLQACHIFDEVADIPETIKINKAAKGLYPWVQRVDPGRASKPPVQETSPVVV